MICLPFYPGGGTMRADVGGPSGRFQGEGRAREFAWRRYRKSTVRAGG